MISIIALTLNLFGLISQSVDQDEIDQVSKERDLIEKLFSK